MNLLLHWRAPSKGLTIPRSEPDFLRRNSDAGVIVYSATHRAALKTAALRSNLNARATLKAAALRLNLRTRPRLAHYFLSCDSTPEVGSPWWQDLACSTIGGGGPGLYADLHPMRANQVPSCEEIRLQRRPCGARFAAIAGFGLHAHA